MIGQKSSIDFDDLGKLEYCSCLLKETLRLYPPSTMTFRELVEDHTVDGYNIPSGTVMVVRSSNIHSGFGIQCKNYNEN